MHDFYHHKLLAIGKNFQPQTSNRYIELLWQEDQQVVIHEEQIDEVDIAGWIDRSDTHSEDVLQPALRILIGSPEEHHSDAEILPLPVSRTTYETICRSWNLPTEFLRMMLSTLPLALSFEDADALGRPVYGLMLRGARSRDWNFCLGLVFNPATQVTCAILNGMQEREVNKLLHCLRLSSQHVRDPMLLPVFLLELKVHFFAVLLEKRAMGIEEVEYDTGMRHGFSSDPKRKALSDSERTAHAKALDFGPITRKLTGVTGTLSFCDMTFSSSKRALNVVIGIRKRLCAGAKDEHLEFGHSKAATALSRRIEYLDELIAGAQAHGAVLSARTMAQVQTVYSMIGQRDNRLNIDTAAASREIAATSLVHNEAMTEIAEDSRKIAMLTRRDSLHMRIIAAVTLAFLPGTFMATMFSSSFFKFLPENSTKMVSGWIWLYFGLTFVVTGIVLVGWWFFSSRQSRRPFDSSGETGIMNARGQSVENAMNTLAMHKSRRHSGLLMSSPKPTLQLSSSGGLTPEADAYAMCNIDSRT